MTTSSAFSATTVVDTTDSVVFNYAAPKLWFSGESAGVPNLFVDAPSAQLVAHRNGDAKNVSALFLHMHNATGDLSGVNGAAGERAQVLRVSSNSEATAASARFKDVPADYPFVNDINWLAQRRITTGYPDGTFRPNGSVERGAMAAFFYRFAGCRRIRLLRCRRLVTCRPVASSIVKFRGWLSSVLRRVGLMVRSVRFSRLSVARWRRSCTAITCAC